VSIQAELSPVCILAGGLGSRLGEAVSTTPKPLIEVAGEPFLFHQLRLLKDYGARRVVICVGYLGEQIEATVGPDRFDLEIEFLHDSPGLDGTAGAVRAALPLLGEVFHVLYGDTYLRIDYQDVERTFRSSDAPALMTVLRNEGRWDTSNALFDGTMVVAYDKTNPTPQMSWIDYGLAVLSPEALDVVGADEPDLAVFYRALAAEGRLAGYEATERFYEIGTQSALADARRFLEHDDKSRRDRD
jgi:NDP-sugar pyrophosphorylase family protein